MRFEVQVRFVNRLDRLVRVCWSNYGSNDPDAGFAKADLAPGAVASFRGGWFSIIDYGLFRQDDQGNWEKFDQDRVWLLRDRDGEIAAQVPPAVRWNRAAVDAHMTVGEIEAALHDEAAYQALRQQLGV